MPFTLSLKICTTSSQGVNGFRNKTMINLPITLHLLRRFELLRTSASFILLPPQVHLRANNPWSIHVTDIVYVVFTVHILYCTLIHGIAFLPSMHCGDDKIVQIWVPVAEYHVL